MADFNKYDNPQMAKKIWNEYEQDLFALGGLRRGLSILSESKTSDELDCRLDLLH